MKTKLPIPILFLVIILEGYVVLSSELLAIRQTIPFVGSGTDTVSIIIAAVLMPLAFGYYTGGHFKPGFDHNGQYRSLRGRLIRNMLISLIIYLIGFSYPVLVGFFEFMNAYITTNRIILVSIYSALFLVTPVYLLGQTIPLISNYFSKEKLAEVTGRILFFSTLGSFAGAIFSTLVLMSTIGVHYTVVMLFVILAGLIIALSKKKTSATVLAACSLATFGFMMNSSAIMQRFNIVENNKYNTIRVYEKNGNRFLSLNNNNSSKFNDAGQPHPYIQLIERIALEPIIDSEKPRNILVIGAGGFTFGFEDLNNIYDFVDIDSSLKKIAEEQLLQADLTENKTFHPVPARGFLSKTETTYDLIVLDVFQGDLTVPEHLVTQEFFGQIKGALNENGILIANLASSPNFKNRYSQVIDNTWRSVFPHSSRHAVGLRYFPWNTKDSKAVNALYIYRKDSNEDPSSIYTDDLNRVYYDRPNSR